MSLPLTTFWTVKFTLDPAKSVSNRRTLKRIIVQTQLSIKLVIWLSLNLIYSRPKQPFNPSANNLVHSSLQKIRKHKSYFFGVFNFKDSWHRVATTSTKSLKWEDTWNENHKTKIYNKIYYDESINKIYYGQDVLSAIKREMVSWWKFTNMSRDTNKMKSKFYTNI